MRWQLELGTSAHPSADEAIAASLYRKLQIGFGDNFKLTPLRTKEL